MRRVLATDFGIWPMIMNMERPSDLMVSTPLYWSRLANYLLMYDQIIVPTGNLQILPVLRIMLGEAVFDNLVRSKGIVLARYDQWFGYAGNGGGIVGFAVGTGPNGEGGGPNLATSFFRPLDEAIDTAITTTNPPSTLQRRQEIKNLLLDNVILLPTQSIFDGLKQEAYKDVESSPYLRDFLSFKNGGVERIYIRPFTTSRMITVRLPPPVLPGGISGSTSLHSSSVRSLGYRNLLRS
jgi:hypothetical protein